MTIHCTINGQAREFTAALSVAEALAMMGLAARKVAVEKNGAIVPKSRRASEPVADGDKLEIVAAIGGG